MYGIICTNTVSNKLYKPLDMKRKKLVLNMITILSVALFCVTLNALLLAGGFAIYIGVNSLYIAQEDGILSELRIPILSSGKKLRKVTLKDKNGSVFVAEGEEFQVGGLAYVYVAEAGHDCDACALKGGYVCRKMDCLSDDHTSTSAVIYKLKDK